MKSKDLELTSRQNAKFKAWLSLLDAKGVKKSGRCLVSGPKLIEELLSANQIEEFILPPNANTPRADIPGTRLSAELFRELDVIGTRSPLAVARTAPVKDWQGEAPLGLDVIVALGDPSNLGALLRSCEAFGVNRVILTQECASPFLPRSIRSSAGSAFRVPLFLGPSLHKLSVQNAWGLDMNGDDISRVNWPARMYLVLGEEGQGLPSSLQLSRVSIPMAGRIESLNAMAAASIALFSHRQKHVASSKSNL